MRTAFVAALTFASASAAASDMVRLEGGTFHVGSEAHYREEVAVRAVTIGPFLIGRTEVTNAEFRAFVAASGYVTTAERHLDAAARPNWPPELLQPRSMVFAQPAEPVNLGDPNGW